MKKVFFITALITFGLFSMFSTIDAQCGRNNGNRGFNKGGNYGKGMNKNQNGPIYDLEKETTVKGTMESFELITGKGNRRVLEITLNTGTAKTKVHIAPVWYIDDIQLDINKGDKLEILGSDVTVDGKSYVIAKKVVFSGKDYVLRDKYGFPKWSGSRNRVSNK